MSNSGGLALAVTVVGVAIAGVQLWAGWRASVSADETAQYAAFHQAVSAEDTYWQEVYNDYFQTVGTDLKAGEIVSKRVVVGKLALRAVPTFSEFKVDAAIKTSTAQHFNDLKSKLAAWIGPPVMGRAQGDLSPDADFASNGGAAPPKAPPPAAASIAAVPATSVASESDIALQGSGTVTLANGRSSGWDVDVFWCVGGGQNANFARANDAATLLAQTSKAGMPIGPGVSLGRIRLRPLPADVNATPGYNLHGNYARPEARYGEPEAAAAILNVVNTPGSAPFRVTLYSATRTPDYISLFACAD